MQVKKSGIRLRHLQQNVEQQKKRDVSPNTGNRKKIFQKLPVQKFIERQQIPESMRSPKVYPPDTRQNAEFEQLVENLKRKSMQLELRDGMIKNLNRQIDDLRRDLMSKEKEIGKLKLEINRLERANQPVKQKQRDNYVFQSFRNPEPGNRLGGLQQQNTWNNTDNAKNQHYSFNKSTQRVSQQNIMMNMHMNTAPTGQFKPEQPEILSPFMALGNKKTAQNTSVSPIQVPRDQSHTFSGVSNNSSFSHNEFNSNPNRSQISNNSFDRHAPPAYNSASHNSSMSSFAKKQVQFDFLKEDQKQRKAVVDKNVDKFNIFGQTDFKSEMKPIAKLKIDDSREFKFQDFDKNDFGF